MATFPEAENRLFKNVYVCRKCERKVKIPVGKILAGKGVCRKCDNKKLRPIKKLSKK